MTAFALVQFRLKSQFALSGSTDKKGSRDTAHSRYLEVNFSQSSQNSSQNTQVGNGLSFVSLKCEPCVNVVSLLYTIPGMILGLCPTMRDGVTL